MALRRILDVADDMAALKSVSTPVGEITDEVRGLVADMLETMYDAPGIGLAAIQIGVPRRVIVMDLSKEDEAKAPQVFVDPQITWSSEERAVYEEGCLSIPEVFDEVERPARVRLTYTTLEGERAEEEADGLYATCIQHEIDHCDGVLFTDYLSRLKRDRAVSKVRKAKRAAA